MFYHWFEHSLKQTITLSLFDSQQFINNTYLDIYNSQFLFLLI